MLTNFSHILMGQIHWNVQREHSTHRKNINNELKMFQNIPCQMVKLGLIIMIIIKVDFQFWPTTTTVPSQWFWSYNSVPIHWVQEYIKVIRMLEDNDDDDIDDDGDDDDNNNESFCPRWRQGRPLPALDGREVGLTLSSSSSMSSSS